MIFKSQLASVEKREGTIDVSFYGNHGRWLMTKDAAEKLCELLTKAIDADKDCVIERRG